METQRIFEIEILPEREAWILFREKTGSCVDKEDLRSVAEDVAKECKGLPVALVTVGRALKNKERRELWDDALVQLRSYNPIHLPKVLADVYKPLKLSYDYLEDEHLRSLFLLCSMFEEDDDISLEMLTWCGMALNLFEGLRSLTEARNRTYALIEVLKDRSLLLGDFDKNSIKMHDVVRDMAIYTALEEKRGVLVTDFDKPSRENCYEDCFWISVTNLSNRTEFPLEFKCPSLRLLMMQSGKVQSDEEDWTLPNNFFNGMQEIRMLSMEQIRISSLLPIQMLKNLRTLCLFSCPDVESISVVGELLKLEILSCKDCHNIEELPIEIGRLNHLRLLEITDCENLKRIVRGVISNLINLEELRIKSSFTGWEAKESPNTKENAALVELEPLIKLSCLEIDIKDVSLVAEEICLSSKIKKYDIQIMEGQVWNAPSEQRMYLEIPGQMNVGNWIKTLLRSAEFLHLKGDGANQVNLAELEKLKYLTLESCSSVKALVNTTSVFPLLEYLTLRSLDNLEEIIPTRINSHNVRVVFPKLKDLYLEDLPRLPIVRETLVKAVVPGNLTSLYLRRFNDDAIGSVRCLFSSFSNLEFIEICHFNGIKNIISPSIARNLVRLETLCLYSCKMMLEVITDDDKEEKAQVTGQISLFPRLEYLLLSSLPELRSFCQWNHHNTTLELPSLSWVNIHNCPQMEIFTQGSVSTPKLTLIRINNKSFDPTKGANEVIQLHRNIAQEGEQDEITSSSACP